MALYRVDLLESDGTVRESIELDCKDDDEAIDLAGGLGHPLAMHLWLGGTCVAQFPPLRE